MKISAIIAEYNPLHNGHSYHIKKTIEATQCDGMIAVISGNFVQRGIPSIVDKWTRTRMALNNGIDLVIELPSVYAVSSAEFFAKGAVALLDSLNIVDYISFGSEEGNIEIINTIAKTLADEPLEFKNILKLNLLNGLSFPRARELSLIDYYKSQSIDTSRISDVIGKSNNILSIEYIKSLINLNSKIKPFTILRKGGSYNSTSLNHEFSSATAIRAFIKSREESENLKNMVPTTVYNQLKNSLCYTFEEDIFNFIKYKAIVQKKKIELPDAGEGLNNKIIRDLSNSDSYKTLIDNLKTKRYPQTRLTRILCQYFIGFEDFDIKRLRSEISPYVRVLGFNEKGKEILKEIKRKSELPLITKINDKDLNEHLILDLKATAAYSLLNKNVRYNDDYLISPIIL